MPATIVGYDHETGFGCCRTIEPLKLKPLAFGSSADVKQRDPVLIASYRRDRHRVGARYIVGEARIRRQLGISARRGDLHLAAASGLERRGADHREGKLVGIGSLIVGDAAGSGGGQPGNMFVPIDRLPPILGDLIADGRVSGPAHPWLGVDHRRIARTADRLARDPGRSGREGPASAAAT